MTESIFDIPVEQILRGVLIFLRIGGLMFALPVFGDQPTPVHVRVLMSLALSIGIYPVVPAAWGIGIDLSVLGIGMIVVRELFIGLLLGYVARLIFDAIVLAAGLVGYQMGFGTAELLMPGFDQQINAFSALHRMLMLLIFLCLNLHHVYLKTIAQTFALISAGAASISADLGTNVLRFTSTIFVSSMELAAPIVVALLFTMTALGLLARTVPQMNVFVMSFPISFAIGLLVYIATIPLFPGWLETHFAESSHQIVAALQGMRGNVAP